MWDQKFSQEEYFYGTHPNDFLKKSAEYLPQGEILCLADGEGRNSVWLAQQGYSVTAVDSSQVGLNKALKLAQTKNVQIKTVCADLADYPIHKNSWQGIVSIFCHLPQPLRSQVFKNSIEGLKHNGVFLLEGYSPNQLKYKTGGPKNLELLFELESLKAEFSPLELIHADEVLREIQEGQGHQGQSAVVQIIARRSY